MAIETEWFDNKKDILVTQVYDNWGWEDVSLNAQSIHDLAMSVDYPVGLVVILPRTMSIPPTGFMQNSRNAIASHRELGFHTVVYVTRVPYTITLWQETISALAQDQSRYFIAGSNDEALEIVSSRAP